MVENDISSRKKQKHNSENWIYRRKCSRLYRDNLAYKAKKGMACLIRLTRWSNLAGIWLRSTDRHSPPAAGPREKSSLRRPLELVINRSMGRLLPQGTVTLRPSLASSWSSLAAVKATERSESSMTSSFLIQVSNENCAKILLTIHASWYRTIALVLTESRQEQTATAAHGPL